MPSPLWNVPNLLSLARIPLAVALFAGIATDAWLAGLVIFLLAILTDWLDGWWARRYGPLTAIGRSLDPLTDKVLVCGSFIYLLTVPQADIKPWMVTVIVARELLVTGLRGLVEAAGKSFGADWFGKLKTALQCAVIVGVLLMQWLRSVEGSDAWLARLAPVQTTLLWAALAATIGSGVQYLVKAARALSG